MHIIATGRTLFTKLDHGRQHGDRRKLVYSLATHLRLVRNLLNIKQQSPLARSSQGSLLEQALCSPIQTAVGELGEKLDPIDVIASYISARDAGESIPIEAARVLTALCSSLFSIIPKSHHNITSHLSDSEKTVQALVRIIRHPYENFELRNAVWGFVCLAVDQEPALARFFIGGRHDAIKAKEKEKETAVEQEASKSSALTVAKDTLENWEALWWPNPGLLVAAIQFFRATFDHALEHKDALHSLRAGDGEDSFFTSLLQIVQRDLGPGPDYETVGHLIIDGVKHSSHHESVSRHAQRTLVKAEAVRILSLDLALADPLDKGKCFETVEKVFKAEEEFSDLVSEASSSPYDPTVHDAALTLLNERFPGLSLEQIRLHDPLYERDLGDQFVFSLPLLRNRLEAYEDVEEQDSNTLEKLVMSINLNLSLAHAQSQLSESVQSLVNNFASLKRGDTTLQAKLLPLVTSVSYDLGQERREGDMMSTIHGRRVHLLLSLLELMWFNPAGQGLDLKTFSELVQNVQNIILNDAQPPGTSVLRQIPIPYHRALFLVVFFCARQSVNLAHQPKLLHAEHRIKITGLMETALHFLSDSLAVTLSAALGRLDLDLDQDMELIVAAFSECIDPSVNPSSHLWLIKCQENDLIRLSLELFTKADISGFQNPSVLLAKKRPLYSPQILLFHAALARVPLAAERLANDGLLPAYSSNSLTPAVNMGSIDVALAELPGDRSPAHAVWTMMLSVAASVVSSVGRHNHYFDSTACAFVQLYHDQLVRALSWTNNDVITFPLLEEIEQVVSLFTAIAEAAPRSARPNPTVSRVLEIFTDHALVLLQQFNYGLTHPNHLATLLEPVTPAERHIYEKESGNTDLTKNTLVVKLLHTMYRLTGGILYALTRISRAEVVLIGDENDWLVAESRVLPVSSFPFETSTRRLIAFALAIQGRRR